LVQEIADHARNCAIVSVHNDASVSGNSTRSKQPYTIDGISW